MGRQDTKDLEEYDKVCLNLYVMVQLIPFFSVELCIFQ